MQKRLTMQGNIWMSVQNKSAIILISELVDPIYSMALDEHLFQKICLEAFDIAFRIYQWNIPAISIGRFSPTSQFDINQLEADGIPLIRRITGGNPLFHHTDLAYTFITRLSDEINIGKELYKTINTLISETFCELGVLASITNNVSDNLLNQKSSCHEVLSRYEVIDNNGKKLAGSAQKNNRQSIMQQGSIYINHDPAQIDSYKLEGIVKDYQIEYIDQTSFTQIFLKKIIDKYNIVPIDYKIDNNRIEQLIQNKYGNKQWSFLKT